MHVRGGEEKRVGRLRGVVKKKREGGGARVCDPKKRFCSPRGRREIPEVRGKKAPRVSRTHTA